jgi:hypothetical protein
MISPASASRRATIVNERQQVAHSRRSTDRGRTSALGRKQTFALLSTLGLRGVTWGQRRSAQSARTPGDPKVNQSPYSGAGARMANLSSGEHALIFGGRSAVRIAIWGATHPRDLPRVETVLGGGRKPPRNPRLAAADLRGCEPETIFLRNHVAQLLRYLRSQKTVLEFD